MSARALVTGGNGFVARWTMRAMLERGWQVTAAGIGEQPDLGILTPEERARVQWRTMDVTRQADVAQTVRACAPDFVVHLAAVSHVPDAHSNPGYAYEVNVVGTVRLLAEVQALRERGVVDPSVLVVGSAEQYGRHDLEEMPLHEEVERRPLTLYAATKVAQEVAALQAFRSDGMHIVCTRSFNHSGVGHSGRFLLPGLVARALALPPSGGALTIGNGDVVRDFLHVSDVVAAYLSLLDKGAVGDVYNVSSGIGTSVRALASAVLARVGVSADVTSEAARMRPVDVPVLVGSNSKLRRATGWTPERTLADIIDDLIHAATH